ncbi:MAG: exodeoxyribonuclease VII small subunit [Rhodospirillaceae bacterium]|jgi:exodeoxyribonuclease VII small subunit|nr:exodeoxyribonuclease VII small subunit [Rhodospirillaceae bacterium]MBT7944441.1 exodeoxyribonuclease VII small subunit [Alphaproteobacteria bacterium]
MADKKIPADIRKMSFEDALEEMEDIVQRLESGQVKLDEAIDAYTRGAHLKEHCQAKLNEAQVKIDKIVLGPGGDIDSEPLGS